MGTLRVSILSHEDLLRARETAADRPGTPEPLDARLFAMGIEFVRQVEGVLSVKEHAKYGEAELEYGDGEDLDELKHRVRSALARCVPIGSILGEEPPRRVKSRRKRGETLAPAGN